MADKTALGVLALVVLASMGAGGVLGYHLGGGFALGDAGAGGTPTAAATPTATPPSQATPTPATTPAHTPTPTATPAVPASAFDAKEVEDHVLALVNDYRTEEGYGELRNDPELVEMARFHSDNMAAQGYEYPTHTAGGHSTEDRYRMYDRYDSCGITNNDNTAVHRGREIEAVGRSVAGRHYERDGERRVNRDERELARAIVDDWLSDDDDRWTLSLDAADRVGVGVNVTDDGDVYATLDLC